MGKRSLPIYWQFLPKKGASNLAEQKAILRPALKLLKTYQIIILGDREFHSAELANWLIEKKVGFAFRQKKTTNIQVKPLTRLVLLIAIAYTHSTLKGQSIRRKKSS